MWLGSLVEEDLDSRDADHARLVADLHRESIEGLDSIEEKIGYFGGVLDAYFMMDAEMKLDTGNDGA